MRIVPRFSRVSAVVDQYSREDSAGADDAHECCSGLCIGDGVRVAIECRSWSPMIEALPDRPIHGLRDTLLRELMQ